jgi:hypothetical protein
MPHQQYRLAQELGLLRREMPDFNMYSLTNDTYVQGNWSSQKNNLYTVRIDVPPGYPDECPSTYIKWPRLLVDHRGRRLESHGTNHSFHIWESDRPGLTKVCTYRPAYWRSSSTLIQLLHKTFLWIIAYEEHRATGKEISDLLLTME